MTSNKDLATRFVDAVNTYIELQNEKRKRYGLADPLPRLDQLEAGAEDLLTQFSKHHFPDNIPGILSIYLPDPHCGGIELIGRLSPFLASAWMGKRGKG